MTQQEPNQPIKLTKSPTQGGAVVSAQKRRQEDALDLALLIYDIYEEEQADVKIEDGQNNAQPTSNS